ncbi:16891_t:CDS:2, partial [Funneliformis caledonium]
MASSQEGLLTVRPDEYRCIFDKDPGLTSYRGGGLLSRRFIDS